MSRAKRRCAWQRFLARAERLFGQKCDERGVPLARKFRDNRTPCSCPMCGNKRRTRGQTRQEMQAELDRRMA